MKNMSREDRAGVGAQIGAFVGWLFGGAVGNSIDDDIGGDIGAFVGTAVHPDDREEALRLLGGYVQELFDEGLTRRDRRYRVLDRETGAYVWGRASLLRLDLDNPRHRRVLLLWQKERTGQIPPETASGMALEQTEYTRVVDRLLGGIQKFRCDRHFTILRANRGLTNLLGYSDR